jgi:hypothetical protein
MRVADCFDLLPSALPPTLLLCIPLPTQTTILWSGQVQLQ